MKHLKSYKLFEDIDFRKEMDNLHQTRSELVNQITFEPFIRTQCELHFDSN